MKKSKYLWAVAIALLAAMMVGACTTDEVLPTSEEKVAQGCSDCVNGMMECPLGSDDWFACDFSGKSAVFTEDFKADRRDPVTYNCTGTSGSTTWYIYYSSDTGTHYLSQNGQPGQAISTQYAALLCNKK